MFLHYHYVARVAFVEGICEIAEYGNQPNEEIDGNIFEHTAPLLLGHTTIDVAAQAVDLQGKTDLDEVSQPCMRLARLKKVAVMGDDPRYLLRDQADNAAPSKPAEAKVDAHIPKVCCLLGLAESRRIAF